jgi:hypothetical protein
MGWRHCRPPGALALQGDQRGEIPMPVGEKITVMMDETKPKSIILSASAPSSPGLPWCINAVVTYGTCRLWRLSTISAADVVGSGAERSSPGIRQL